jgi:topoisomerase IA-like protein
VAKKNRIPHKFQPWIDARKRFRLTDAQIQMARELGLSPKRFGSYADRKQQPWKLPLAEFIETLYEDRFKKLCPDEIKSMEQIASEHVAKRAAKKAAKLASAASSPADVTDPVESDSDPSSETVVDEGTP